MQRERRRKKMPKKTTNYSLIQPYQTEVYDVEDFNTNAGIIDGALKDNADGLSANETRITSHENNKENPHGVTAEQVGLGNAAEDIEALKAAMPRGTKFIKIGADTVFGRGFQIPSQEIIGGNEIYVNTGRVVRVDIYEGLIEAKRCGLCLAQSFDKINSVVVFVKEQPQEDITLAVTDMGKCKDQDGTLLGGIVINGLISAGLDVPRQ